MALRRVQTVIVNSPPTVYEKIEGELVPSIFIDDANGQVLVGATVINEGDALAPVVLQRSITLTLAQILTLPTTPVVIVPATEILDFAAPTVVPIPQLCVVKVDNDEVAFTNRSVDMKLALVLGSTWDASFIETEVPSLFSATPSKRILIMTPPYSSQIQESTVAVNDNALAIGLRNDLGDLVDGGPNASMKVTVYYSLFEM